MPILPFVRSSCGLNRWQHMTAGPELENGMEGDGQGYAIDVKITWMYYENKDCCSCNGRVGPTIVAFSKLLTMDDSECVKTTADATRRVTALQFLFNKNRFPVGRHCRSLVHFQ